MKHLEFIQAIITRMAGNSFLLKGWSVTLVAALFALAANQANTKFAVVAFLPVVIFWLLDAFFLSQERCYRALYNSVRGRKEGEVDFDLDASGFCEGRNSWIATFFSRTLILFYLPMIVVMLIVIYYIK